MTTRTSTAIRFPADLHDQLMLAAEERGLSINFLVVAAVRDFLPRLIPADQWSLTVQPAVEGCGQPDHPAPFFCRDCGDRACCCTCHGADT